MAITVSTLSSSDIDRVDELMKRNSKTLGFLPREALRDYLTRNTVLGAEADNGALAGYLLYAEYPERYRIAHLCVSEHFRGRSIAKHLLEALVAKRTTQCTIRLNCRKDYDAHHVWPKLGFDPVDEKPGRSAEGLPLVSWELRLSEDSQLDLFKEKLSDQALDIVIDAHVLFHFAAPESPQSIPSKALLADFLADTIHIQLTDEIFHEIDRNLDAEVRRQSRTLAHLYPKVTYDHAAAKRYEINLQTLMQPKSESDKSDVRHLAKTAASDVGIFVTRDNKVTRRSDEISALTGLELVSPTDLIRRLHEMLKAESYIQTAVSGQSLAFRQAGENDSVRLLEALRQPHEVKGRLRETLDQYLSLPNTYIFEILERDKEILAARVAFLEDGCLRVPFIRAANGRDQRLIQQFLISDSLASCAAKGYPAILVERHSLPHNIDAQLISMGFREAGAHYKRLCLTGIMLRGDVEAMGTEYFHGSSVDWATLSDNEILTGSAPVVLEDRSERCFLVPIRPEYAMSLFDNQIASNDMFGGRSKVLMRWDNVYFRSKTHHNVIKAPARLLWYESGNVNGIRANSQLLSVEVGSPKDLFRKYRKFGTFDWSDINRICGEDVDRQIMAMEFAHTFTFRQTVTLADLRRMEGRRNVPLQSPRLIGKELFLQIMRLGYQEVRT